MVVVGFVIELILWSFILLVLARIVVDWVQMFARSWHPQGPFLVLLEIIYTATDPPILLLRRMMPPLRIGGIGIDLSVLFVLIICYVLQYLNQRTLLYR